MLYFLQALSFCKQGAGFYVPYDEVENYMHLQSTLESKESLDEELIFPDCGVLRVHT